MVYTTEIQKKLVYFFQSTKKWLEIKLFLCHRLPIGELVFVIHFWTSQSALGKSTIHLTVWYNYTKKQKQINIILILLWLYDAGAQTRDAHSRRDQGTVMQYLWCRNCMIHHNNDLIHFISLQLWIQRLLIESQVKYTNVEIFCVLIYFECAV